MEAIIEFFRWDRDPQGNYHYGPEIDRLLDELAGPGAIIRDEMKPDPPPIPVAGFDARLQLHESGPEIFAAVHAALEIIGTSATLFGAWLGWKQYRRGAPERTVTLTVGPHRYEGTPTPEQAKRILECFAAIEDSKSPPVKRHGGHRPRT